MKLGRIARDGGRVGKRHLGMAAAAACGLLAFTGSARATSLLNASGRADVTSTFLTVSYDANTDLYTASGFSTKLNFGPIGTMGTFNLSAHISSAEAVTNAHVTITGGPSMSNVLYDATTVAGFQHIGADIAFCFTGATGSLANGTPLIVKILGGTSLPSSLSFADNYVAPNPYTNTGATNHFGFVSGNGNTVTADALTAVPTPTAAAAGFGLLGGLGVIRRRRRTS